MGKKNKEQRLKFKSPAEFFAENQNIAGFDNAGKALYTTIRELVENSLDAAESIRQLPTIELRLTELSAGSFADLQGLSGASQRVDKALYASSKASKGKSKGSKKRKREGKEATAGGPEDGQPLQEEAEEAEENVLDSQRSNGGGNERYFKLTCIDNGCGMPHDRVPQMFGRVLSGSKYGVKQARGKFGLGAKMALIWSKKSTGLPIEITTAHTLDAKQSPSFITHCVLDIDIHKNQPNIRVHEKEENSKGWHGSKVELVISGNWRTYKARILQYMQMLAVITPYAEFTFVFESQSSASKSFTMKYKRRSEQMCKIPKEVKFHPKSVDNLIIRQLLNETKKKTMENFLCSELAGIKKPLAKRLVDELVKISQGEFSEQDPCSKIPDNIVQKLTSLLRDTQLFAPPDASCLSPAGEYNLRLGIMKEYEPELIATGVAKPGAYNGHPFTVEAAVAFGGAKCKPGLNIYRFANRIPLLFEPGNDVVSITAHKRIKWSSYRINHKLDKISVFVSIVSTKIPFKGTGKEYIGDISEIANAVREALRKCCNQIKKALSVKRQRQNQESRMKNLQKYVPTVASSLFNVLEKMGADYKETALKSTDEAERKRAELCKRVKTEELTASTIAEHLGEAIEKADHEMALEAAEKRGRGQAEMCQVFLIPRLPKSYEMAKPFKAQYHDLAIIKARHLRHLPLKHSSDSKLQDDIVPGPALPCYGLVDFNLDEDTLSLPPWKASKYLFDVLHVIDSSCIISKQRRSLLGD